MKITTDQAKEFRVNYNDKNCVIDINMMMQQFAEHCIEETNKEEKCNVCENEKPTLCDKCAYTLYGLNPSN